MFLKMLAFEWRYYVRQPSFYVTCLTFFLLPFLATVSDNVQIGGGGNVLYNSSFAITQTMLILGIFSMFLVVNFLGSSAIRNEQTKMAEILYSKPIQPLPYQLGRFIGAYLVTATVFLMVPLGILLGTLMPWIDADRVGPTNLSFYIDTYVYFSLPTLFVFSCFFFAVAQKFKTMMSVYLTALALFIFYIVTGNLLDEPAYRTIAALSDPFGLRTFGDISRYWTAVERNTESIELAGVLLQNRLIWIGVGIAVLAIFAKLNRAPNLEADKSSAKSTKKSKKQTSAENATPPLNANIKYQGQTGFEWQKFLARTRFEIKQVMHSPPFYILLLFSLFNLIAPMFLSSGTYGVGNWPITQEMVDLIRDAFSLMIIIVITYYSGEVVWRERNAGMGDIVDSMPVFNLSFWMSKIIAVWLVVISLYVIGMVGAVINQVVQGYEHIDFGQYFISLFLFDALPWMTLVVLAFFLQVVSANKYIGMLLLVGYIFSSFAFNALGIEHNMWRIGQAPNLRYSDMNGYGFYGITQFWYMTYWIGFSIILTCIGYGLWQRGPQVPLKARFKMLGYQLGNSGRVTIAAGLMVFLFAGSTIFYNTRVVNEFVGAEELLEQQAEFEKLYDSRSQDSVPTVTKVNANFDLYPTDRRVEASALIEVVNKSDESITEFLVSTPRNAESWKVEIEGGQVVDINQEMRMATFKFDKPLRAGEKRTGLIATTRDEEGFRDKDADVTLIENGTFINNFDLFPVFGVDTGRYINDRHERRKRELDPPKRAHKLEDSDHHHESFFGTGTDFIEFEATISTSEDQFAITPGYLQKEWIEDGRRYFHYKMDAPMVNFYAFLSARLEKKLEMYKGINIEVYYHKTHDMNIDRMIDSTKASIDYFSKAFGPYQHKQLRVIEFPRYRAFAQSFANTVPYSEDIGFISDLRDENEIDFVYYVTAHELAHQWWGHQVGAANVQGSQIIVESLSQYSALMVMEKKYGPEKLRKFLKYELDRYLRGRTSEILEEMPLMRAEDQAYIHYRKGSVAMMSVRDRLGEERMNSALKTFLEKFKYKNDPFPTTLDLINEFNAVASADEQAFIKDLFEDITLYDLRAEKIEAVAKENGKHEVTLTVNAKRFTADGKGVETEAEMDEWVDIVLFSDDPESLTADKLVIYQNKHKLTKGENTITIEVDEKPKFAGVDPFVKLVDRDTEDNVIRL